MSKTEDVQHKIRILIVNDVWDHAQKWLINRTPVWRKFETGVFGKGHSAMDWFVFNAYIESVKHNKQTSIDVYDSITTRVITPLSALSI